MRVRTMFLTQEEDERRIPRITVITQCQGQVKEGSPWNWGMSLEGSLGSIRVRGQGPCKVCHLKAFDCQRLRAEVRGD